LPGGFSQIIETGVANDKFSLGDTSLQFNKETVWVIMLTHIFFYSQMLCSDQSSVQRYCAMRSDRDAKQGLLVGAFATLPVWIFFTFIGTALFVFYMVFPTSELQNIESEQILPYFILTQLPAGVSGFILAGLFAAAMSTLDSGINAAAATITTDFYRRLCVKEQTEHHYLTAGRWFSVFLAVAMVLMALLIHFKRDVPLVTLQQLFFAIISGGLLGLFLLGFLTKRVDSISALIATICTTIIISVWLALRSKWGINAFPSLAEIMPHEFWINVLGNIFLFVLGYMVAFISGRFSRKNLRQLTVWTVDKNE
jgi:SSS family solute:Na+ symporter